jgi:hypothetical protein
LRKAKKIQEGQLPCNELIGCFTNSKTTEEIPPAIARANNNSKNSTNNAKIPNGAANP